MPETAKTIQSASPQDATDRGSNSKLVVLSDQAIVSATNFLTTIIVGNACGAELLGVYVVGFSVVLLGMAIESSFVSTPFTVMSQDKSEWTPAQDLGGSFVNLLITCLLVTSFQFLAWLVARSFLSPTYDLVFQTVILVTPFFLARSYSRKVLLATFRAGSLLTLDLIVSVLQVFVLWNLAQSGYITPAIALAIAGGCNLFGIAIFLLIHLRNMEFAREKMRTQIGAYWSFGKWLVAEQILTISAVYGSPWLLVLLMGSDSAGVFAACLSITGLINPFFIGIGNYLLPRFSAEFANRDYSQQTYWSYMTLTFLVIGPFAAVCALWPNFLLEFFYPDDSYAGFGVILAIMTVRTLVGSMGLITHLALLGMHKPVLGLYASLIGITVFLGLSLTLIPWFGIVGGAVAWSVSSVFESMFMIIAFQIVLKLESASRLRQVAAPQNQ